MNVHAVWQPLSDRQSVDQTRVRWQVNRPVIAEPHLDAPCGRHLKYRDIIECGKTWHDAAACGQPIDNHPRALETWTGLERLCSAVLDPAIDRFGSIELTYGFGGPTLARLIRRAHGSIAPGLDQHAAHERSKSGRLICERGGAAVDFRVAGSSSRSVALWIVANTPFDRLFFYGDDRPIHVSASAAPAGQIVVMWRGPSGRLIPKRVDADGLKLT